MPGANESLDQALILRATREAEALQQLADRIDVLIATDQDALRQALYRLDIPEPAARLAAAEREPSMALARLIVAREREKSETRMRFRRPPPSPDDELAW
jgi:hypothetical protein